MSTGVFSLFSHLGCLACCVTNESANRLQYTETQRSFQVTPVFQATSGQNRQENETHEERPSKDWEEARLAKLP